MKKLFVIIAVAAALAGCYASVQTPKSGADVEVGSTKHVHPTEVQDRVK